MKLIILLIVAFSVNAVLPYKEKQTLEAEMDHEGFSKQNQLEFENWMMENEKTYDNDYTMKHRMQVYMKNKLSIDQYNKENHKDKQGLNQFSDLEVEEFASRYLMKNIKLGQELSEENLNFKDHLLTHDISSNESSFISTEEKVEMKDSLDWSSIVNPVQYQGQCGSSWAFAVADVVISRLVHLGRIRLGQISKQHMLDCTLHTKHCSGCAGCHPIAALYYVREFGLMFENEYPAYFAKEFKCLRHGYLGKKIKQIVSIVDPSDQDILDGIKSGPVVALFSLGNGQQWFYFKSGYIDTCRYRKDANSLAVTITGYDDDNWIIKNSWGTNWGINGYFYYPRINKPQCQKMLEITYPVF